jgi:Tol biopolymer transport system component
MAGRRWLSKPEAGARAESWLTFSMVGSSWSFTTSDASLATWPSEEAVRYLCMNPSTGTITQFTYGMDVLEYSSSEDGMMIYFSAVNNRNGADLYQINRAKFSNTPGGLYKPEKILACGAAQCRSPVVSHNGQYLAYEHLVPTTEGILGPALVSVVSMPEMDPIPLGVADHETVQPSWSPTGELIFYDRTSQGYVVVNLQTRERVEIPNHTGQPGSWSPDGKSYLAPEIFYYQSSEYAETGASNLIRYEISTGTLKIFPKWMMWSDVEGEYSPEGEVIALHGNIYTRELGICRQLWIMNADGSNPHPITDDAYYNHYDLAWSRDGRFLAFVRF